MTGEEGLFNTILTLAATTYTAIHKINPYEAEQLRLAWLGSNLPVLEALAKHIATEPITPQAARAMFRLVDGGKDKLDPPPEPEQS